LLGKSGEFIRHTERRKRNWIEKKEEDIADSNQECEEEEEGDGGFPRRRSSISWESSLRDDSLPNMKPYLREGQRGMW